jgi:hypothetical protein
MFSSNQQLQSRPDHDIFLVPVAQNRGHVFSFMGSDLFVKTRIQGGVSHPGECNTRLLV